MRRVKSTAKPALSLLLGVLLLLALGGLGWREIQHQQRHALQQEVEASLEEALRQSEASVAVVLERKERLTAALEDRQLTIQSLEDRCGNLEAQRDHLRAEMDRLAGRNETMAATVEALQSDLEEAREELLEAQGRPLELMGQLRASKARNAALENQLDAHTALGTHLPATMEVTGISTDKAVFSLAGELPEEAELPMPVYLCGTDGIYLDGWLHRREEEALVGHVKRWREDTSTLVKGQKVFILPRNIYEADSY